MGWFDISPAEITEGSVPRALLVLSAPLFVQNMVRVAQQVVDLFWIGRYSGVAVAAIGLASPVISLLMTSSITASFIGTQVLVSQRVGSGDSSGARSAAFTGSVVAVVLGFGVGLIIFYNAESLLAFITSMRPASNGSTVLQLATTYLEIIALGIIFAGLSDVIEAAFIGWGDSRASFYMNVVSVVGNIGLDPVFIFGLGPVPAMGIQGAALATVCGYIAGFLLGLLLVAAGRAGGIYSWASVQYNPQEFYELLSIGLPRALQGVAGTSAEIATVAIVYVAAGAPGLAAYTVGTRVSSFAFRTVSSLSQAAQSIVGQNLGANYLKRARSTTLTGVKIAIVILSTIGLVQWLIPDLITLLFVPEIDEQSFVLSVAFLQIFAIGYPAEAALSLIEAGFNGARQTKISMISKIIQTWIFQVPMAIIGGLVLGFGAFGVFWARVIPVIIVSIGLAFYYIYMVNDGMYTRAAEYIN